MRGVGRGSRRYAGRRLRLCRWLLRLEDRTEGDGPVRLPLTQDFLAETLGAHRASITAVARACRGRAWLRIGEAGWRHSIE